MHCLLAMVLSVPAWAADEPSNATSTTWEIYGFVALVFVVGFAYVLWYQKKEEKPERHRKPGFSNPA
ncbi:MAG: hypothetical protein A3G80_06555 [Betaproteobacteria bacterium RIFCSPLOWO2_12_FULL_62_13b]|nr:MAG: hypothetical protein A3G80_06555 [Betaproteobacteria bacterium RIFCSPLOWO2_12_FULL_62_13b]